MDAGWTQDGRTRPPGAPATRGRERRPRAADRGAQLPILKGRFDAHSAGLRRAYSRLRYGPAGSSERTIHGSFRSGSQVALTRVANGRSGQRRTAPDSAGPLASALRVQVTARDPAACPVPTRGVVCGPERHGHGCAEREDRRGVRRHQWVRRRQTGYRAQTPPAGRYSRAADRLPCHAR